MTFVILNVSTGIIMTSYTKVTHNFDVLQRHSLIDVLVQRAFTDQLSDAYLVWKIRARLRVASFKRNVLALCRRHSAETLARPDVEYISDEQLLASCIRWPWQQLRVRDTMRRSRMWRVST